MTSFTVISNRQHSIPGKWSLVTGNCSFLIHRNALNYRLDKIASLIGLDPRRFMMRYRCRLALLLRKLQSNSE